MNIPEDEMTREKCLELRQNGTLKVMFNLLHAHTIEPHGQSEADFDPERFRLDFNQHDNLRRRLALRIRKIIQTTTNDESELMILYSLDLVRSHIQMLYVSINAYNNHLDSPSVPSGLLDVLFILSNCHATARSFVEQFGGLYVILDLIRAQTRFFAPNREYIERQSHNLLLKNALATLYDLMMTQRQPHEVTRRMLGNCRSFHEQLVTIIRNAHADNELDIVKVCCNIISAMFVHLSDPLTFYPDGYMSVCGVVRCLAELLPQIADPLTRLVMLISLTMLMEHDQRNVIQFCSTDGSIGALVDILAPRYAHHADGENAETFQQHRETVMKLFSQILVLVSRQLDYNNDDRLLRILEERDIAVVLFPHVDEQFEMPKTEPEGEKLDDPVFVQQFFVGGLFNVIRRLSNDQAQKIEQLRRHQD